MFKRSKKKNFNKVLIPRFEKSNDDRSLKKNWQMIKYKPDVVIFEVGVSVLPLKKKRFISSDK